MNIKNKKTFFKNMIKCFIEIINLKSTWICVTWQTWRCNKK